MSEDEAEYLRTYDPSVYERPSLTVDVALISLVVAVSARKPFVGVARSSLAITVLPFALMASAALILVVLWEASPLLSAALVGPLLAIALYQRSTFRELRAMRLALTDPLTGLGNHRHFHDRLERELADSQAQGYPLSLCLIDIEVTDGVRASAA